MQPAPTERVSVLIADDQRLVRTGFRVILASEPGIEVVGEAAADQLITAVRCVAAGDALIDPSVTRRLIARFTRSVRPAAAAPEIAAKLTAREMDVLRLIARGLSNTEIAAELVVEESAVKTHVGRVLTKLTLRDRVQAVVLAYETGLVTPDQHEGGSTRN
jgi:DNA-binding NarL/FixJ family response regulator